MQNSTWYNNQVHGCCNIAVQSCYFIIPWQHVLSCMNMVVDLTWWSQQRCSSLFVHQAINNLFQQRCSSLFVHQPWTICSNNIVQVCSFIKPWTVCSNMHEQACQQHCSIWPAQPCSSLSTGRNKLCVFMCVFMYAVQSLIVIILFYDGYIHTYT